MTISREEALRLANIHAASGIANPDYRMWCEYSGKLLDGWLFSYRYRYLKPIPPGEEHRYALAGAPGFIVSVDGSIRDLPAPKYFEAEQRRMEE
jgi:hypothetical protein